MWKTLKKNWWEKPKRNLLLEHWESVYTYYCSLGHGGLEIRQGKRQALNNIRRIKLGKAPYVREYPSCDN